MNLEIPALEQFSLQAVDEIRFKGSNEELKYSVEIEPQSITSRIIVALISQKDNKEGMAVAIYPATGEVCDVCNGGGVIGYLSNAPLRPNQPIQCELNIFRFGKNFVCNANIGGETFLYPAFSCDPTAPMAAMVGKECHSGSKAHHTCNWNHLSIELQEFDGVIAA